LLIDQEQVADDIDEEDINDFQRDLFLISAAIQVTLREFHNLLLL
jgi:hypothetical protein